MTLNTDPLKNQVKNRDLTRPENASSAAVAVDVERRAVEQLKRIATPSRHLDARRLKAVNRIGDYLLPGDGELPRFSKLGCVREVDRVLDFMPAQDLADLKMLLGLLGYFPQFLIAFFMTFLEWTVKVPGSIGGLLRTIRVGLRGLAMTLYYSDPAVLNLLDYQVKVYTGDLKK